MVKREVVGAHYGLRDWLAQRMTAVVMIVYTLLFLIVLTSRSPLDYAEWKALWASPVMRYATMLFVFSLLVHAWVGVREIFMDYVKPIGLRLTLYGVVILALLLYGAWSMRILGGL